MPHTPPSLPMPVVALLIQNPETPEKRGRGVFYDQCENIFAAAINFEVKLLLYWALICRHGGTCLYRALSTMGGGVMPVDHCGGMVSVERARAAWTWSLKETGMGRGRDLGCGRCVPRGWSSWSSGCSRPVDALGWEGGGHSSGWGPPSLCPRGPGPCDSEPICGPSQFLSTPCCLIAFLGALQHALNTTFLELPNF